MTDGFTPTEVRILNVLSDGEAHTRKELMGCLNDELTGFGTLAVHIHGLRKKLRERGEFVVTERPGRSPVMFRHVILLRRMTFSASV